MSDQPSCACSRVEYRPEQFADGSYSSRWCCALCGTEFVRASWRRSAERERLGRHAAEERVRELEGERDEAKAAVDTLRRSFDEATMVLSRMKLRQEAMGGTSTLPLELPKGNYNILRSGLASGRAMCVVLPEPITTEATEIVKELSELSELADAVAGMQPS